MQSVAGAVIGERIFRQLKLWWQLRSPVRQELHRSLGMRKALIRHVTWGSNSVGVVYYIVRYPGKLYMSAEPYR